MRQANGPDPDERISEGAPRQIGVRWPSGVDRLVDELVIRANAAGANCNRKELTAALVVESHALSGEQLLAILIRYRQATIREILPVPTAKRSSANRGASRG